MLSMEPWMGRKKTNTHGALFNFYFLLQKKVALYWDLFFFRLPPAAITIKCNMCCIIWCHRSHQTSSIKGRVCWTGEWMCKIWCIPTQGHMIMSYLDMLMCACQPSENDPCGRFDMQGKGCVLPLTHSSRNHGVIWAPVKYRWRIGRL